MARGDISDISGISASAHWPLRANDTAYRRARALRSSLDLCGKDPRARVKPVLKSGGPHTRLRLLPPGDISSIQF